MSEKKILTAENRDLSVKNKTYRQQGYLIANVSGEGKSQALITPLKEALGLLSDISESTVFYLSLDGGKNLPVMLAEIQKDPLTNNLIHLALRRVNLKEKVTAAIPISVTGEFSVPDAVYLLVKDEVEAEALPTDLPEEFIIDISQFTTIGEQFTFAQLDYDRAKVTLDIESEEEPIVVVNKVEEEVEEAPAPEATEDGAPAPAEPTEGDSATPAPAEEK